MRGYSRPTPHLRTLRQFDHGKGAFQILFDGFFPLKGAGGYPPSLTKVFLQKYCPQRGGGSTHPPPNSAIKKQVFLIQKEYFGFSTCYWWVPLIPLRIWVDLQMKPWLLLEPEIAPTYTVTCSMSTAHILMTSKYDTLTHVKPHEKHVDEHHFQPWCFIAEKLFFWMYWSHCFCMDFISGS